MTTTLLPTSCETSSVNGRQTLRYGEDRYCEDGYLVFQRRFDGSVDFQLNWNEYKNGFGSLSGEFWLGLDEIHRLTQGHNCRLRVDLEAFDGDEAFAEYSSFSVGDESEFYRLYVDGFSGPAGNSLIRHNGQNFSTSDRINGGSTFPGINCATYFGRGSGGWWFHSTCLTSALNAAWSISEGPLHNIIWFSWKQFNEALKATTMKIRCQTQPPPLPTTTKTVITDTTTTDLTTIEATTTEPTTTTPTITQPTTTEPSTTEPTTVEATTTELTTVEASTAEPTTVEPSTTQPITTEATTTELTTTNSITTKPIIIEQAITESTTTELTTIAITTGVPTTKLTTTEPVTTEPATTKATTTTTTEPITTEQITTEPITPEPTTTEVTTTEPTTIEPITTKPTTTGPTTTLQTTTPMTTTLPPTSCETSSVNGRQTLRSGEERYCEDGYLVFQRRFNGSVDFQLNWNEYKNGFGSLSGEFWLGLDEIHRLTQENCRLRVDLEAFDGDEASAEYSSFSVDDESELYALHVDGYSGTAEDSLLRHNDQPFSTPDRINGGLDGHNCATDFGRGSGGWWFHSVCLTSALNAAWGITEGIGQNILWTSWKGFHESLKATTMKIRCD